MYLNCSVPQKYHSQAKLLTNKNENEKRISLMSPTLGYNNAMAAMYSNELIHELNKCTENNSETMVLNSSFLAFFRDISLIPYVTIPNSAITIK